MQTLIRLYEICLFRQAPQDLPYSQTALGLALLASMTMDTVLTRPDVGLQSALLQAVVGTAVLVGFLQLTLAWRGLNNRLVQALTAIAGVNALIELVAWPVTGWARSAEASGADGSAPALLLLGLVLWSLGVLGHILRHTLEIPLPGGVLVGLLYVVVSIGVISWAFPA